MRLCHVAHGMIEIPPPGWGAVEWIIWNYKALAEQLGHELHIINSRDSQQIIRQVNSLAPHVLHLHDERKFDIMPALSAEIKILCPHDGQIFNEKKLTEQRRVDIYQRGFVRGDFYIHCLSHRIRDYFANLGIPSERLFTLRNGSRSDQFAFSPRPRHPDRSIYLGRISRRKRQFLVADLESVDFVGPKGTSYFNYSCPNYFGEWSRDEVTTRLTNYANLILLSHSEAAPLVTCEALMAGLGLVLSEHAAANLDTRLPFITVVTEHDMRDKMHLYEIIQSNRRTAVAMRDAIRKYALENFELSTIVNEYFQLLRTLLG